MILYSVKHTHTCMHMNTQCYFLPLICIFSLPHMCAVAYTHGLTDWVFTVTSRSCSSHFRSTMWHIVAGAACCWLSSEVHTKMREIERTSQMPFPILLHPQHASVYFSKEDGVGMESFLTGTMSRFLEMARMFTLP